MARKFSFLFILFLVFNLNIFNIFAFQDKTEPPDSQQKKEKKSVFHPHEEVVVTATATRKVVKDCSVSVSVVSNQDIKAISASNALNLLNFLPGIFIERTGDLGRADVNIRGIGQGGRRIAILVDGRPEKMGLFGCAITHAFPLDNVARIEVVRGPASVLYGSEAVGGVVNIITREPKEGFVTDFSASYGSYRTAQFNLRHGGRRKGFSYYLTFDRRQSDGHRPNSSYKGSAFTGKMSYAMSNNFKLTLETKYFSGKKYEAGPVDFPLIDYWNDYKRGAVDLTLAGKGNKSEFYLKAYSNFGHHRFSDGWHSRDYVSGGIFRYTSRSLLNNELTLGGDFRILGGRSYNWPQGRWDKNEAAVFVQDEYVLGQKWILSAGFRLHRDSIYGLEGCPHGGLVFKASQRTTFRAVINKGFRSPQLNELYMFPAANQDLKPEKVWNFELGFDEQLLSWLNISGAVYHLKGSNLIETTANPSPPPLFKFQNSGQFSFSGAELSLSADISRDLSAVLFYSYLDPGDKTKGRAGQKWDFSLRFQEKSVFASLQAQHVAHYFAGNFSGSPLPSYFLLNARLDFKVLTAVNFFLDLNNIFNEEYLIYVDLPGTAAGAYPMPGRNFNLGIRIHQ